MGDNRSLRRLRWAGTYGASKPSAVSLADSLRVCAHRGVDALATTAAFIGEVHESSSEPDLGSTIGQTGSSVSPPSAPPVWRRKPGELDLATFLRAVEVEQRPPDYRPAEDFGEPLQIEDITGDNQPAWLSLRDGPPLARWSRLAAHLHHALSEASGCSDVDTRELVRRWSRGVPVDEIPRRQRRRWPDRVIVIVDHARRLSPFWPDQSKVYKQLLRLLGPARIEKHTYRRGPDGGVFVVRGNSKRLIEPRKGKGGPVLALTDLGLSEHDGGHTQAAWRRLGRRLLREGHSLHALVPVPRSQWDVEITKQWQACAWERGGSRRGASAECTVSRADLVEQLLELASVASRVEPGLLRELRYLVPGADAGVEAEVWNHPAVVSNPNAMFVRDPQVRNERRERFAQAAPELREQVMACMTAYHTGMPLEVLGEELLNARTLCGAQMEAWEQVRERLLAIAAMLSESNVDTRLRRAYLDWVGEMAPRLPAGVWQDPEVGRALTKCFAAYRQGRPKQEEVAIPEGLSPRVLAAAEGEQQPPQTWYMAQSGNSLAFTPEPPLPSVQKTRPWSPLHMVVSSSLLVQVERDGKRDSWWLAPEGTHRHRLGPLTPGEKIVVHTDYTSVTLEGFKPPGWANGMGRDAYGLWASISVGRVTATMRWIAPGSFMMGSREDEPGRSDNESPQRRVELTQGYWLMDTACTQALWKEVVGSNSSNFKSTEHPVESVDWEQAVAFCEELQLLLPGSDDEVFQLPTEAQWEYACRAGTTTPTYAGGNAREQLAQLAWYVDNSEGTTHPVRGRRPNNWGLYDMLGNVWEWCADGLGAYIAAITVNPTGCERGAGRVVRGGSWLTRERNVRAACRGWDWPGNRVDSLGFRLARGPAPGRS